ncbi:MAG: hypothetical protein R2761_17945 [Acidimicrobiales bacterium]
MTTVLARPDMGRAVARLGRLHRVGGDRFVHRLAAAILLPLVLFLVLQPETFGITPNNLDPMFYTGLGINFDDAVKVGANHYFITRWSAWYPLYLADQVAGPFWGRLVLRWAATSAVLIGLWHLRPRWTWPQRLLSGAVLVTMPMFLRPLMTDYTEYAIVLFGLGLVTVALREPERQSARTAAVAGVFTGLLAVANPLTVLMVVPPLALMVLANSRWLPAKLINSVVIGVTAALVVAVGLAWFRWLYDIPNIYQPTIDFLRNPPGPDLLRSPNRSWLARFTWLYVPPFTAGVAALASLRPETRLDRLEWQAVGLSVVQWLVQWADQFLRHGTGLELSYYWSFSFPTLGIAVAMVTARLASHIDLRRAAAVVAGLVALLLIGVPSWLRLPHKFGFVALSLAVALAIGLLLRRRSTLPGLSLFVAYVTLTQVGAPPYHPLAYHFFDASPRYDHLFWGDGDQAEEIYREAVWFEREMDKVPDDEDSVFLTIDNTAGPIQGIYHPHVGGQLIGFDKETNRLRPIDRLLLLTGRWSELSILGPPDKVAAAIDTLARELPLPAPSIDEVHDSDLGFRLVAFPLPSFPPLPLTIEASDLPTLAGRVEGTDVVADAGVPATFAVYGPYLALPPGRYTVTLHYTSTGSGGASPGTFDVFTVGAGAVTSAPLDDTDGAPGEITLPFEATTQEQAWEFRVRTEGNAELVVDRLVLGPG